MKSSYNNFLKISIIVTILIIIYYSMSCICKSNEKFTDIKPTTTMSIYNINQNYLFIQFSMTTRQHNTASRHQHLIYCMSTAISPSPLRKAIIMQSWWN